eukprot:Gb_40647 [translate_table: standard]
MLYKQTLYMCRAFRGWCEYVTLNQDTHLLNEITTRHWKSSRQRATLHEWRMLAVSGQLTERISEIDTDSQSMDHTHAWYTRRMLCRTFKCWREHLLSKKDRRQMNKVAISYFKNQCISKAFRSLKEFLHIARLKSSNNTTAIEFYHQNLLKRVLIRQWRKGFFQYKQLKQFHLEVALRHWKITKMRNAFNRWQAVSQILEMHHQFQKSLESRIKHYLHLADRMWQRQANVLNEQNQTQLSYIVKLRRFLGGSRRVHKQNSKKRIRKRLRLKRLKHAHFLNSTRCWPLFLCISSWRKFLKWIFSDLLPNQSNESFKNPKDSLVENCSNNNSVQRMEKHISREQISTSFSDKPSIQRRPQPRRPVYLSRSCAEQPSSSYPHARRTCVGDSDIANYHNPIDKFSPSKNPLSKPFTGTEQISILQADKQICSIPIGSYSNMFQNDKTYASQSDINSVNRPKSLGSTSHIWARIAESNHSNIQCDPFHIKEEISRMDQVLATFDNLKMKMLEKRSELSSLQQTCKTDVQEIHQGAEEEKHLAILRIKRDIFDVLGDFHRILFMLATSQ